MLKPELHQITNNIFSSVFKYNNKMIKGYKFTKKKKK